jgi:uncharacterized protein with HEPN domain
VAAWEPSSIAQRLRDVVIYGNSILETVQNLSFEDFARDPIRQKAVAYDFQCVSEATAGVLKLDPSLSERYPSIPWSQVRALANVTRHEYGRLDVRILWQTATGDRLAELIRVARTELGEPAD